MKIKVKNFRTIRKAEINLEENQINFFIGSNESGKSNVLDVIRVIGEITDKNNKKNFFKLDKDDATINDVVPGKTEDMEFYIEVDDMINLIDSSTRESKWLSKDFPIYKEYSNLVNNSKNELEKIINKIHNDFINLKSESGKTESEKAFKYLMSIIKEIQEINFINLDDVNYLTNSSTLNYLKEHEKLISQVVNIHKNKIARPFVYFVEPILNAMEDQEIQLDWSELSMKDSFLRKIINSFATEETVKSLNEINKLKGQIDSNVERHRASLIRKLNKQIAKYFNEDLPILKGVPELRTEGTKIILDIQQNTNFNYKIDNGNEKSRSTGFKSFLRIIFEIKTLAKSTNDKIVYIIDEPEQGLHPFLQTLLMEQIAKIVESQNNKMTFVISSHSPYIINPSDDFQKFEKNLNFVHREDQTNEEFVSGETIVKKLIDTEFINSIFDKWSNSSKSILYNEEMFLLRMVLDSKHLNNLNRAVKKKIKEIQKNFKSDKDKPKFMKELKKAMLVKDIFK